MWARVYLWVPLKVSPPQPLAQPSSTLWTASNTTPSKTPGSQQLNPNPERIKIFPFWDNVPWNDFAPNEPWLGCCALEPLVCMLTRRSVCVECGDGWPRNGSLFSILSPALGCACRNPGMFHGDCLEVIISLSLLAGPNQVLSLQLVQELLQTL